MFGIKTRMEKAIEEDLKATKEKRRIENETKEG